MVDTGIPILEASCGDTCDRRVLRTLGRNGRFRKSRIKAPYDVADWWLSPTTSPLVVLLGLALREIYVSDVLIFPCAIPKSTGHQAIAFSLHPFKGDPAFKRGAMEQEVLAKWAAQPTNQIRKLQKRDGYWQSSYE